MNFWGEVTLNCPILREGYNLNKKLKAWENFYTFNHPHGAFNGKTPYEVLKCTLQ